MNFLDLTGLEKILQSIKNYFASKKELTDGLNLKQDKTDNTLTTTDKTMVGAINEVKLNIGNLDNLTTTEKTDLVKAINEIKSMPIPQDGREIELQKGTTHIQWRYVGEIAWINLVSLDEIKGERGIQGIQGVKGNQGLPGVKGDKGDTGTFDTTTEFQELVTVNKTVIGAINELNNKNGNPNIVLDPYKNAGTTVYKYNNHAHTTNSDGSQSPTDVLAAYKNAGYLVTGISDHDNVTTDEVSGIKTILGSEESTEGHINCMGNWNMSSLSNENYTSLIEETRKRNAKLFVTMNHPKRPSIDFTDQELLNSDCDAIEIFNGNDGLNYEDTWDKLLSNGKKVWGICADDCHDVTYPSGFQVGWCNVLVDDTPNDNIFNGLLQTGGFDGSSGTIYADNNAFRSYIRDNDNANSIENAMIVEPNVTYNFGFREGVTTNLTYMKFYFWQSDGTYISRISIPMEEGKGTITSPANAHYMLISNDDSYNNAEYCISSFPIDDFYIGKSTTFSFRHNDLRAKVIDSLIKGNFYAIKGEHDLDCTFDETTNTITATSTTSSNIQFIGFGGEVKKQENGVTTSSYQIKNDDYVYMRVKSINSTDSAKYACSQPYYIENPQSDTILKNANKYTDTVKSELNDKISINSENNIKNSGNILCSTSRFFNSGIDTYSENNVTIETISDNEIKLTYATDLTNSELDTTSYAPNCIYNSYLLNYGMDDVEYVAIFNYKYSYTTPPTGIFYDIGFRRNVNLDTNDTGQSLGNRGNYNVRTMDTEWHEVAVSLTNGSRWYSCDGIQFEIWHDSIKAGTTINIKDVRLVEITKSSMNEHCLKNVPKSSMYEDLNTENLTTSSKSLIGGLNEVNSKTDTNTTDIIAIQNELGINKTTLEDNINSIKGVL